MFPDIIMHFLKTKSNITKYWKPLVVICLNILQCNASRDEGKSLVFLANGEERSRPLVSENNTPLNLTCHMPDSEIQIKNDKGQLLNASVGVVSVVVNSTSCQHVGTYMCHTEGQMEVRIVLFINGCDPVLCDYKQNGTILTANLSTDVNVAICFLINKENLKTLVMQYGSKWIRHNAINDKVKFDVIQNKTDHLYKILNITIRNITLYDYGEIDVALPVTGTHALKFKIYVFEEGYRKDQFKSVSNNSSDLTCTAYNYPKTVSIRKKMLSPKNLSFIENNSLKPYLKLIYLSTSFSCSDIGTYECVVTDMQGITRIYEHILFYSSCSSVLKLCDWQLKSVTIKSYIGGTVNVTVCMLNTFNHFPAGNITQSPMNSFNYTINTTGVYTSISFSMSEVKETSFRKYTIHIGESIDVNVVKSDGLRLCKNKSEDIIYIKPNESAIFSVCIITNETLNDKILINNNPVSRNGNKNQYHVFKKSISQEEKTITIEILNFTNLSTPNYKVQISSTSGSTLSYRVLFKIKEPFLEICKGDHDNVTVAVRLNSPAVVHLCISSNVGLGEYISIDDVPYQIYGSNRLLNYCVSADVINQDRPFDYYIQIYIRNVTEAGLGNHVIKIRPTKSKIEIFRFCLQEITKKLPVGCPACVPKTYFFSKVGNVCNLKFCVIARKYIKHRIFLNNIELDISDTKENNSVSFNYYQHDMDNDVTKYIIELEFTVQTENFTRYNIQVYFRDDAWNHTFYLLDDENLKNVKCTDGTTDSEKKATIYSNISYCMRVFGVIDSHLQINNDSYPIEPHCPEHCQMKKVIVVQYFSIHTLICHLVVYINNLTNGEFVNYDVLLPSIEKDYNFKVELIKFPIEIQFYETPMGQVIDSTSLKAANIGQELVLTCKVSKTVSYPVKLTVIFQSRTLVEINNETSLIVTFEHLKCRHLGTYACIADMDFQRSKMEITLNNSSCQPRWCASEDYANLYTISRGEDFQLPLCFFLYMDLNLSFILNGTLLTNAKTSNVIYEKISYDNNTMKYKARVTVKNVSLKDYGYYLLTILRNESPTVYLNQSFFLQEGEINEKRINLMTLNMIIIIIIAVLILITSISIIISIVKKKARRKINDGLNSTKAYIPVKNEIDFHENVPAPYENVSNLKVNNHYENVKAQGEVIPLIDMNDLNKKMDNRIYMNSQELLEIAPRYGHKTDNDKCNSMSDRDSNGLIYITLAHVDQGTSATNPRPHELKDDVVYATLDYNKTGKITLQETEKLCKKYSKRKNDS